MHTFYPYIPSKALMADIVILREDLALRFGPRRDQCLCTVTLLHMSVRSPTGGAREAQK